MVITSGDRTAADAPTEAVRPIRWRRLVRAPLRWLAILFVPDRALPEGVSEGWYAGPLVCATLAALLSALTVAGRLDVANAVAQQQQPDQGGGPAAVAEMSDREYAEALEKARAVELVKRSLGAGALPLELFGLALALYVVTRYVGGRPTLRRAMALAAASALPGAVRSSLETVAALQRPALAPGDVAALAPSLHGFDPFSLWSAVLILLGLPAMAGLGRRRSVLTVAVCFALWLVLTRIVFASHPTPGAPT
jgi:hypothetical protein